MKKDKEFLSAVYGSATESSGTAAIYARYSSHSQNDASIEQQVEECEAFAKSNNLTVVAIYPDRHLTGRTDQRPEFHRMIHDAKAHKFKYIITWKVDRFARSREDAAIYKGRLRRDGVRVLYAKESIPDGSAGVLLEGMLETTAEWYSVALSENVTRGMRSNAMECKVNNGGLPLGYCKGEDGKYKVVPDEAEIVREIFKKVSEGVSFVEISGSLNGRGIKTSRGGKWNKNSFRAMLKNERYIGVYEFGDIRIEDGVPPIVDKALFAKVKRMLETKPNPQGRHRVNSDYILTGKLFCGKCGSPMVGVAGTSKTGKLHNYYVCQNRRTAHACDKKNVQRDYIEREVINDVRTYILQDNVIEWIADSVIAYQDGGYEEDRKKALQRELGDVEKSIKNLIKAIEAGIITESTKDRLNELEEQRARLKEDALIQSSRHKATREEIIFWLESLRDGDVEDKAYQTRLIDTFIKAIYLYDDKLKIVFSYTKDNAEITRALVDDIENKGLSESSYKLLSPPP